MKLVQTILVMSLFFLSVGIHATDGQTLAGTEFTYQGRLVEGGQPATGTYNMRFSLWNAVSGGSRQGNFIAVNDIDVVEGVFSVELDFTPGAFNNDDHIRRWIQVEVESTVLTPRQPLTGTPFAIETRGLHVREDGGGFSVGIGQPSSTGEFTVFDNTTGFGGMWVETAAGGQPRYAYKSGNNISVFHYVDGNTGNWGLRSGGSNLITAAPGGFVGINRSTPVTGSDRFTVYSDTVSDEYGGMYAQTNAGGKPFYGYAVGNSRPAWTYWNDNTNSWRLHVEGGDRVHVLSNGNVGIGVSAPAFRFQVNGECAKPGGGSWSNASDRRLKKNVNDLDGSLEKLMKLRGVTFEYLDAKSINELDGERVGVIAQEVEKVFPDWIAERTDGFKSVTFRGFEALTIEALRELRDEKNSQIKTLELSNAELSEDNDELRNRLEELEMQVQSLVANMQQQ